LDLRSARSAGEVMELARESLQFVEHTVSLYSSRLAQHAALDYQYLEDLPYLMVCENLQMPRDVCCAGRGRGQVCEGPARFYFNVTRVRTVAEVEMRMKTNRNEHNVLMAEPILPADLSIHVVRLESIANGLVEIARDTSAPSHLRDLAREAGRELFFEVVWLVNRDTLAFPPTEVAYNHVTRRLGGDLIAPGKFSSMGGMPGPVLTP
jgi:hypothetical protein